MSLLRNWRRCLWLLVVGAVLVLGIGFASPRASVTASLARDRGTGYDTYAGMPTSPPMPPTPTSAASMTPPAGARVVRDLSRASYWDSENGGYLDELAEKGPEGDPVLRSTLVDGQTIAGQELVERNDLQGGEVPLGSTRWMVWNERFVAMPDTDIDSWQLIGPNEIHGSTLPMAPVNPQVGADKRRRLNANAGRAQARDVDLGPIVLNQWHQYKFGIHYTQGNDGWIEIWKDGVRVVRAEGPTTTEPLAGYWKFGHYRNAAINGTSVYDISGCRVYGE